MEKIYFYIGTLREGGAERVISILSNNFSKRYDVEIITFFDDEIFYQIKREVTVRCIEREVESKSNIKKWLWLRNHLKRSEGIHISFLAPVNMMVLSSAVFLGKNIIVADRNDPRCTPERNLLKIARDLLYKWALCVVVQTTHNYRYFKDRNINDCVIIPNPIHPIDSMKTEYTNHKKIVSVGRLIEQKNQTLLLKAFATIHGEDPDYELYIYGEGNYRPELERLIQQLQIEDVAFLPGTTKDIIKKIKDATFFVLSSNYEGMPNALIEAMCVGLPVISTMVSGSEDLIVNNESGLIVEINNQEALESAMRKFIIDEDFRRKCGENAKKIQEKLDEGTICSMWEDLFESKSL